jgi:hypothetical protein
MDYHAAARIHHEAKAQAYRAMHMRRKASSHSHRAAVHARLSGMSHFGTAAEEDDAKKAFFEYAKSKGYEGIDANVFKFADGTYPELAFKSPKLHYDGFTFHKDHNRFNWFLVAEREGRRIFAILTSQLTHNQFLHGVK